jgi:predicted DNA-binding transcriptional regulator AlpA
MDSNNELLLSHNEAMRRLGGIGRTTFYGLIEADELEQVHIGRRSFITADSIEGFVNRLKEAV